VTRGAAPLSSAAPPVRYLPSPALALRASGTLSRGAGEGLNIAASPVSA